jgi:hypothetical protein
VEMAGLVETVESQRQASHEFPQPLGNLAKGRRDSHIPTAPTSGGKVENQKQVSHFPAYGCGLSGGIFRRGGRAVARLVRGEQKAIRRLSRQGRIIVVDRE